MTDHFDVVIIGSGAGGGTMAYALSGSGARILILERGDFVPQEDENWDPDPEDPTTLPDPEDLFDVHLADSPANDE